MQLNNMSVGPRGCVCQYLKVTQIGEHKMFDLYPEPTYFPERTYNASIIHKKVTVEHQNDLFHGEISRSNKNLQSSINYM